MRFPNRNNSLILSFFSCNSSSFSSSNFFIFSSTSLILLCKVFLSIVLYSLTK
ncbi:007R [Invertebrate iridescent virus Kaz2018]|nr:007R [Invertebrate iridescent virus Kaz2018]